MTTLLEVRDLDVGYGGVDVVHGLDLTIPRGPYGVGVIGESGSGKTTLARALLRLQSVSGGSIVFDDEDVLTMRGANLLRYRKNVQMVFQDGDAALDPRMSIQDSVGEPLAIHRTVARRDRKERVAVLIEEVGLPSESLKRYPHQLSGGQRQRAVIARALALAPRLLVLDEPTSALDVTIQARVLDLVEKLREERGLAYLLISHNLAIVDRLCETSLVLYLGRVLEHGPTHRLLQQPAHPYTQALRAAVPEIGTRRKPLARISATTSAPTGSGCVYAPRCPLVVDRCRAAAPALRFVAERLVACHRAEDSLAGAQTW